MIFNGKRVLVVGIARSGRAALKALYKRGAVLSAYDAKTLDELGPIIDDLNNIKPVIFAGIYPPISRETIDLIVVSPGVPLNIDLLRQAADLGIPIISELELAYLIKSPQVEIYAVTGTNGKTTTTSLLDHILKTDGRNSEVGGNIGVALCDLIDQMPAGVLAVEVSSFQLETSHAFKPHICGILNITPDHLDRHNNMENYIFIKSSIFARQTKEDYAVLNYEDEQVKNMASRAGSRVVFFSTERVLPEGVFVEGDIIQVALDGQKTAVAQLDTLTLRGKHNLENILCAVAMAWVAGVDAPIIKQALSTFAGVRHRLEEVAEYKDVLYINDSKGTNPDSTIKALQSFERPVILIAGGRPKGGSYAGVAEWISKKAKDLVLLGEAKDLIKQAVMDYGFKNIHEVEDFPAAVYKAHELAQPGDVVLLSPACASWDMFKSYEHRGDLFCEIVRSIVAEGR